MKRFSECLDKIVQPELCMFTHGQRYLLGLYKIHQTQFRNMLTFLGYTLSVAAFLYIYIFFCLHMRLPACTAKPPGNVVACGISSW